MRISDWSSDVCSSDLDATATEEVARRAGGWQVDQIQRRIDRHVGPDVATTKALDGALGPGLGSRVGRITRQRIELTESHAGERVEGEHADARGHDTMGVDERRADPHHGIDDRRPAGVTELR